VHSVRLTKNTYINPEYIYFFALVLLVMADMRDVCWAIALLNDTTGERPYITRSERTAISRLLLAEAPKNTGENYADNGETSLLRVAKLEGLQEEELTEKQIEILLNMARDTLTGGKFVPIFSLERWNPLSGNFGFALGDNALHLQFEKHFSMLCLKTAFQEETFMMQHAPSNVETELNCAFSHTSEQFSNKDKESILVLCRKISTKSGDPIISVFEENDGISVEWASCSRFSFSIALWLDEVCGHILDGAESKDFREKRGKFDEIFPVLGEMAELFEKMEK